MPDTPQDETKRAWTPGPWSHHYDDNGFFYVHAEQAPSPYIVATGNEGDVDRANARLIAAAPDLYEALDNLVDVAEVAMRLEGGEGQWAVEVARAALFRARGEQ